MKLEMKALEWRDPLSNAQVEAAEKALARQRKAERAAKKHEKAVEREKSRLARIQLAKTGRLRVEEKQNEYLAALKLDVAKLEAKKTGQTPAKLIAKHDKERVSKQAEEREEMVLKETKLTAEEMLKVRERELEEKRRQEMEIADLAERRRRELLEYKHSLGLLSSPHPASRPSRFPDRPASLHDDPEFWRLSMEDRYAIELMDPGERAERCGFGPYEEDEREWDPELHERFEQLGIGQAKMHELKGAEAAEKKLLEKMKQFICTEQPNVPGVLRRFPPIDLSLPLTFTHPDVYDPADRPAVVDLLREHQQYVRDDLVRHAIEQFGANALLEMRIEGPVDVEPQEGDEEVIAELRATGVPVRLDPNALASLLRGKGKGKLFAGGGTARQHPKQHNAWSSTGWNNDGGGWDDPAVVDGGVGDGWATGATNWGGGGGGGEGGWRAPMAGAGGGGGWSTGGIDPWTTQGGNGAGGWGAGGGRGWKGKGREQNGGWGGTMGGGGEVGWGTGGKGHWGGGGGWGQGDRVWGQAASQQQHPQAPPEVRNLPFGAQIYIKRMREQQEREAREAALHSMNPHLHPQQPPPAQTPFVASSADVAREDAAIFGNAFARSAFPSSPFIPASHDPVPTVAAQQATVDPDHGGQGWRAGAGAGGATDGGGWEQPTAAEVSQGVTPAAENGWKGTQPW